MASGIIRKLSPSLRKIIWGEKWASTLASTSLHSRHPPRLAFFALVEQKLASSYGRCMYGEKWIWHQRYFVPRDSNEVKKGVYQIKAAQHFNNLRGPDPSSVRENVQASLDEAQKYVKLVVDVGKLVNSPLQVVAATIASIAIIRTSLSEITSPGSTLKKVHEPAASAHERFESKTPDRGEEFQEKNGDSLAE